MGSEIFGGVEVSFDDEPHVWRSRGGAFVFFAGARSDPSFSDSNVIAMAVELPTTYLGAEPDVRKIMVGSRRVPYWQGGPAFQPYARGYFGNFGPLDWMFMGFMFNGLGEGLGALAEGMGEGIGAIGDGIGSMFDGMGDMFDGFDF